MNYPKPPGKFEGVKENNNKSDYLDISDILLLLLVVILIFSFGFFCGTIFGSDWELEEKCAQKNGAYDFCVQEVSYKVK